MSTNKKIFFADLPIKRNLLKGIYGYGMEKMSETQKKCIMPIMLSEPPIDTVIIGNGFDKTTSYCISVIQRVDLDQKLKSLCPQALIIVASRELAYSVSQIFDSIGKYSNLKVKLLVISSEVRETDNKCHVIIGTPGITALYIKRGILNIENLKILVFDEMENLLSMGIVQQNVCEILTLSKNINVQICFCCSGAISKEAQELIDNQLVNPIIVGAEDDEK